jgi:hypothetical protein
MSCVRSRRPILNSFFNFLAKTNKLNNLSLKSLTLVESIFVTADNRVELISPIQPIFGAVQNHAIQVNERCPLRIIMSVIGMMSIYSDSHLMSLTRQGSWPRAGGYIYSSHADTFFLLLKPLFHTFTDLSVEAPTSTKLSSHSPEWSGLRTRSTLIKVRSESLTRFYWITYYLIFNIRSSTV